MLTREQLYEHVWSRAMIHVAKEFGLSDRGLAKLCERHEIPVPPRGYWAKKAHGHKVPQPPLKPPSRPGLDRIEISPAPPVAPEDPAAGLPEVAFELLPENRIVVQPGRRLHPFVRKTAAALKQAKPGDRGLLYPIGGVLAITVSRPQRARALHIMNALLHAIEARGWPISLSKDHRGLTVTLFGEQLNVSLNEKSRQVPHVPTRLELDYPTWSRPPYDLVPAGVLRLRLGDAYWQLNETSDTAKQPLEDSLNAFLVRLIETAHRERVRREEREAAELRRQEEERTRREEEEKEQQWNEWMDAWDKCQRIRGFAAAVEKAFSPVEPGSKIAEWLEWSAGYADRNDPLREAREQRASERDRD